jgi:hypothetical protein
MSCMQATYEPLCDSCMLHDMPQLCCIAMLRHAVTVWLATMHIMFTESDDIASQGLKFEADLHVQFTTTATTDHDAILSAIIDWMCEICLSTSACTQRCLVHMGASVSFILSYGVPRTPCVHVLTYNYVATTWCSIERCVGYVVDVVFRA